MLYKLQQDLVGLREINAHHFDPVRFRFIESLLERAATKRGPVQQVLENKVSAALTSYRADQHAVAHIERLSAQTSAYSPQCSLAKLAGLRELLDQKQAPTESATSALERTLTEQENLSLAGAMFTADISAQRDGSRVTRGQRPLKANQEMQVSQQRLSVVKRVELAIQHGPESPGPLNPQMLAIKALTSMRDLSPQYLSRYINYLDALFWLEHAAERPDTAKAGSKPRKAARKK
ncbi:MAG: hypothetical protein ACI9SK_001854 [Zhongshania sp.]|jgi:hypothetical protein